ncbi:WD40-repeat-containing domain protein [Staphylotrichum tortipilum]|uniref:Elongator complex protein 2 n=1 Tax=Staphylotrichum tortipilum TaxID=2831512 RepID=A0AAN6RXT8_9PEZI|nr:WD40-repeat-containing domain protein [Staphylotrichum longicolle]
MAVESRYLSAGANRYAAAADWSEDGLVAFGSDSNVCLWDPTSPRGISHLLSGHTAHVRAVKFLPHDGSDKTAYLVTGGDDTQLRLWAIDPVTGTTSCAQTVQGHSGPINCIASLRKVVESGGVSRRIFVTGAADGTIKVWALEDGQVALLQTIKTTKKYIPLTVALSALDEDASRLVLAVGGTTNAVQIFTAATGADFTLQATLPGHENWIRSLDFVREKADPGSDLLLASASQDKYVRLWRIHEGTALSALSAAGIDLTTDALTPGNKMHKITAGTTEYCIMFEALLLGHEDWIYSARWSRASDGKLQLLSASADNSLSVWESDAESGIWITAARLGEISREKGATTATGSIGGFWTGLWSPSGTTVITLGRTGSWRRWDFDAAEDVWKQNYAISGHTRAATGISWSRDSSYLLSTSSDQTTRLHAEWTAADAAHPTWHEMARPQIHGYDLNCISTLGPSSFVSGANEKLMRVFTEPKPVARMLSRLTNTALPDAAALSALPDAANMPVLGLSNKAMTSSAPDPDHPEPNPAAPSEEPGPTDPTTTTSPLDTHPPHPPFEESLSRHTLFPETEKLYGHGYEISCLAATRDGSLIASACRASSLNHAVVRLVETRRWTELRPPLAAHTLTVARLRFSPDDKFLLSVGRDRQWAVFGRKEGEGEEAEYVVAQAEPKGHARMILDAAWAPLVGGDGRGRRVFATAGRDKLVKVWVGKAGAAGEEGDDGPGFKLGKAITLESPVTALDFVPEVSDEGVIRLAVGTEAGKLSVLSLRVPEEEGAGEVEVVSTLTVPAELCLPKAVIQLAWRPAREGREKEGRELAIAGEDGSLRIYAFASV